MDTELKADDWRAVVAEYKKIVEKRTGKPFPQEPHEQLWGAIGAVFGSWMNQRAITYRRLHDIPDELGHRRQRAGHGVRQHGRRLRHRRGLHPRSVDRREPVLRRVPGERPGRGRGGRHPHAAASHRGSAQNRRAGHGRGDARGLPAAGCRAQTPRDALQATCRTSSSPSSAASSTCCRPATASAPPRPPSRSRSTWCARG